MARPSAVSRSLDCPAGLRRPGAEVSCCQRDKDPPLLPLPLVGSGYFPQERQTSPTQRHVSQDREGGAGVASCCGDTASEEELLLLVIRVV
jgi:hypothetical protein